MAINLGTAYLQLEPNTTGLVPGVKKAFGGVESVAAQSGDKSGKAYADAAGKGSGGIKGMATKLGLIGLGVAAAGAFVNEFTAGIAGASALQQSKGAVEAIFCLLAMRDNVAPPTLNLDNPSIETSIDLVPHKPRERKIDVVLSNSFGFGGTNASLILRRVNH